MHHLNERQGKIKKEKAKNQEHLRATEVCRSMRCLIGKNRFLSGVGGRVDGGPGAGGTAPGALLRAPTLEIDTLNLTCNITIE